MLVPFVEELSRHDESTDADVGDGRRNDVDRVLGDRSKGVSIMGHKKARCQRSTVIELIDHKT